MTVNTITIPAISDAGITGPRIEIPPIEVRRIEAGEVHDSPVRHGRQGPTVPVTAQERKLRSSHQSHGKRILLSVHAQ